MIYVTLDKPIDPEGTIVFRLDKGNLPPIDVLVSFQVYRSRLPIYE